MRQYLDKKYISLFAFFALAIVGLPLSLYLLNKQSDIRQRAATTATCPAVATDTVLVIDKSSSMQDEILQAKTAAKQFVDAAATTQNRIGLVVYDKNSTLTKPLTSDFASVKSAIDAIVLGSGTCIQCGVKTANTEIQTNGRAGIKKTVILLSDGKANAINGVSAATADAEKAALTEAVSGFTASQTTFYTIGLGTGVNAQFLQQLATSTGGAYYFSPDASKLAEIYALIADLNGKGSIAGAVYHDINNNKQLDMGEPYLTGWTVQLKSSTGTIVQTTTSGEGGYSFTGLCNGTYSVHMVQQSNWSQTVPDNNGDYTVNILTANAVTGKNFAFIQVQPTATPTPKPTNTPTPSPTPTPKPTNTPTPTPSPTPKPTNTPIPTVTPSPTRVPTATPTLIPTATPTRVPTATLIPTNIPTPGETIFRYTVFLHSIGKSGDNSNPLEYDYSNKNPLTPTRNVMVEVYNAENQPIVQRVGSMQYDKTNGNFTGSVSVGSTLTNGPYTVKLKTDKFLKLYSPGIQNITAGQTYTLPVTTLVAGDINDDNRLNILDYNILIGCYTSDINPKPKLCDNAFMSDLNDEGKVDRYDYNLFIRELAVQSGD